MTDIINLMDCYIDELIDHLECKVCYKECANAVTTCCKKQLCFDCEKVLIDQNRTESGINAGKCLKNIPCPYCKQSMFLNYHD